MENIDTSVAGSRRGHREKKLNLKKFGLLMAIILTAAAVFIVGYLMYQSATSSAIDNSKFQAVFLTNGQVYFGKLKMLNGGYMKLNDIYYLQTKTTSEKTSIQDSSNSSSDVSLIKLGSEIHGPSDEMIISKDQILFFENIKSDSKVSESITEYKKKQ